MNATGPEPGARNRSAEAETLYIQPANPAKVAAYMALAYPHASERARQSFSLEAATKMVEEFGVTLVVTDTLGSVVGGLCLMTEEPLCPFLCWALLPERARGTGLAQDMAGVLISHHFIMCNNAPVDVQSLTEGTHVRAERALMSMGFMSEPFVCKTQEAEQKGRQFDGDGLLVERGPVLWSLPPERLTQALADTLKVEPRSVRKVANPSHEITVIFLHPMTLDGVLKIDLETIVRARRDLAA